MGNGILGEAAEAGNFFIGGFFGGEFAVFVFFGFGKLVGNTHLPETWYEEQAQNKTKTQGSSISLDSHWPAQTKFLITGIQTI